MNTGFYDAHNHLQDDWLAPHLDKVAEQLSRAGLRKAVVNGTCEVDWHSVSDLSRRFDWVIPSFGLHPWDVGNRSPEWSEKLQDTLARHPGCPVGEVGLDKWILDSARPDDPRLSGLTRAPLDQQSDVLRAQLELASRDNRAITIHCLEAWGALAEMLRQAPLPARGFLLHAYGGSAEMVKGFAQRGAYFSFNGAFLEERKTRQRETFKVVPLDRLLVETDAPAMPPPQAWRTYKLPPSPSGQTINHPGNIETAYAGLASILGMPLDDLMDQVEQNFQTLFGR